MTKRSTHRPLAPVPAPPPPALAPLAPEWTFVLQFRAESGAAVHPAGRLEHLPSGRAFRFSSLPDLLSLLTRELSTAPTPDKTLQKGEP